MNFYLFAALPLLQICWRCNAATCNIWPYEYICKFIFLVSEMKLSDIFMICLCQDKNANKYSVVKLGIAAGCYTGSFTRWQRRSGLGWHCSLWDYCAVLTSLYIQMYPDMKLCLLLPVIACLAAGMRACAIKRIHLRAPLSALSAAAASACTSWSIWSL